MSNMVKPLLTLFALLLTQSALSQDCPVQVRNVYKGLEQSSGSGVFVNFMNLSDKELVKTSFAVTVLDSAGEQHALMGEFESKHKTKPGTKQSDRWWVGREVMDPFTKMKFHAWVKSVQFKDGTSWKDDGTHACSAETK
jgi:hypothetical protein